MGKVGENQVCKRKYPVLEAGCLVLRSFLPDLFSLTAISRYARACTGAAHRRRTAVRGLPDLFCSRSRPFLATLGPALARRTGAGPLFAV